MTTRKMRSRHEIIAVTNVIYLLVHKTRSPALVHCVIHLTIGH